MKYNRDLILAAGDEGASLAVNMCKTIEFQTKGAR